MSPDAEGRVRAALAELGEALIDLARKEPAPSGAVDLISVAEFARRAGVSRSSAYMELSAGRTRSIKIRGRRLIPASELSRLAS